MAVFHVGCSWRDLRRCSRFVLLYLLMTPHMLNNKKSHEHLLSDFHVLKSLQILPFVLKSLQILPSVRMMSLLEIMSPLTLFVTYAKS